MYKRTGSKSRWKREYPLSHTIYQFTTWWLGFDALRHAPCSSYVAWIYSLVTIRVGQNTIQILSIVSEKTPTTLKYEPKKIYSVKDEYRILIHFSGYVFRSIYDTSIAVLYWQVDIEHSHKNKDDLSVEIEFKIESYIFKFEQHRLLSS